MSTTRSIGILFAVLTMMVAVMPVAASASEHGACGDPYTPIYEIQGDGFDSPLDGAEDVVTEGLVTVSLQAENELSGFFIQDRRGDGDPATSDGIFVQHRDTWSPEFTPAVGDLVRIQGDVDEQFGNTQIEFLSEGTVCRSGNRVRPTAVDARTYTANGESFEGMYLRFPATQAVTDTFNLHQFGEVWLAESDVVEQPTNEFPPGTDATVFADDNMARSFLLDDSSTGSNPLPVPYFRNGDTLRLGDTVRNLTGAIYFSFGNYRVEPQSPDEVRFSATNRREAAPSIEGDVVVGSANVLNYWTTLGGRGADTEEQLAVQTDKLVAQLLAMNADVIALQEVENDLAHTPITTLVDAMNAAEGHPVWQWIGELDYYNLYPIRNEIIYRGDTVRQVGAPVTIADPVFDDIPEGRTDPLGRPPVAQTFRQGGDVFTVVVNHFKSKGCTGSTGADEDQGDGQSCFNATRVAQAERVLEFVDDLVVRTGDPDVLVVGDLNAYLDEDPVLTMESELVNVVRAWDDDPYSFNFFAGFAAPWIGRGLLDHALATDSMNTQVSGAAIWHNNADEPRVLDWFDPTITAPGPYRASDHDPVTIGLDF
jgi:predicted extracellular nuclease